MEEAIFRIFSFCVQLSVFPDPLSVRHAVDNLQNISHLESHSKGRRKARKE